MAMSGISAVTNNQPGYGQSAQDTGGSAGGWKYVSVREGGKIYTYIVIGKNMRILIGEESVKEDNKDDKKKATDDGKAASGGETAIDGKTAASAGTEQPAAVGQKSAGGSEKTPRADFLPDLRMFALTGYYQQKLRETMKNLQDNLGSDQVAGVAAPLDAGNKPDTQDTP